MLISTEDEYESALKEVEPFFDIPEGQLKKGTPECERFLQLCDAIYQYEEIHYPIVPAADIQKIRALNWPKD